MAVHRSGCTLSEGKRMEPKPKWQTDPDLQSFGFGLPEGQEWLNPFTHETGKMVGPVGGRWDPPVEIVAIDKKAPENGTDQMELRLPRGVVARLAQLCPDGISGRTFLLKRTGKGLETRHSVDLV